MTQTPIKIALCGAHGTGKTKICEKVLENLAVKSLSTLKNIEDNELLARGKRILNQILQQDYNLAFIPEQCREVVKDIPNFTEQTKEITLATYSKQVYLESLYAAQGKNILCDRTAVATVLYFFGNDFPLFGRDNYSKIYLIEPSDRSIEDDGFRSTDKTQQREIHDLFLTYFKDHPNNHPNVEIINQEDAHKDEFIQKITNQFIDKI